MKRILFLALLAVAALGAMTPPRLAFAVSPRNPYRSFNLSGVNYGLNALGAYTTAKNKVVVLLTSGQLEILEHAQVVQ